MRFNLFNQNAELEPIVKCEHNVAPSLLLMETIHLLLSMLIPHMESWNELASSPLILHKANILWCRCHNRLAKSRMAKSFCRATQ